MTLPLFPSILATGKALARRFDMPMDEKLVQALSGQDTSAIPDATGQVIPEPSQIQPSGTQVPIQGAVQGQPQVQPQPIQPGDIAGALGAARPRQEFVQPQTPDIIGNVLAGRQIAETPDTVQTLNGVQEPGITGEAREIPDAVAAEAPGLLQRFGEGIGRFTSELATNPVLQDQIAQVAQALSAREPRSFPFQLATGIRESAQGAQQDLLRQATLDRLAGREPDDRIDPNMLTLSPELRTRAQLGAIAEIGAAADIQKTISGIPTGQERAQQFELTEAQIAATDALTQQRDLETIQSLTSAGIGQEFDSTQLSLLRLINDTANKIAAQAGGIQGVIQDPSGNTTFQFKNPEQYTRVFNETRDVIINNLINAGALPENARLLSTRTQADGNVSVPDTKSLDKTTQPPDSVVNDKRLPKNAKFLGSKSDDGKVLYYFDTNGDGIADTAVRK